MTSTKKNTHKQRTQIDVARLYEERSGDLLKMVKYDVKASAEVIEDACAFAWAQLIDKPSEGLDEAGAIPWLRIVARNEAYSLLRKTGREPSLESLGGDDESDGDYAAFLPGDSADPQAEAELAEEVETTRRMLASLKPNERKALGQLAAGYSYREIASMNGWTYTKVNRLVAEGRDRLRLLSLDAEGRSVAEIADEVGLSEQAVERGLAAAGKRRAEGGENPPEGS